jgi:zinc protease
MLIFVASSILISLSGWGQAKKINSFSDTKTKQDAQQTMSKNDNQSSFHQYMHIQKTTLLDNNVELYLSQSHELPIVDIKLAFDAGSIRDGQKFGLAAFTADMLGTGTENLNENELINHINATGAEIEFEANKDMSTLNIRSMTMQNYLDTSIKLAKAILTNPEFNQDPFQRTKQQILKGIQMDKQSPENIASDTFYEALYAETPYAHPVEGTENTVSKIRLDDIENFYESYYNQNNVVISMVGDINIEQAKSIAKELIENLPKGTKPSPINQPSELESSETIAKQFSSTQTAIMMGTIGIEKGDPKFFPLMVGNHILGGSGLNSRLFEKVRKENGLAYGVSSAIKTLKHTGSFVIQAKTRNDAAEESLKLINQTLSQFIENGPSSEEIEDAKKYIRGSFPLSFANNQGKLRLLNQIAYYDLPLDYYDHYLEQIDQVTKKDIMNAFESLFQANPTLTVTVGDDKNNDLIMDQ